MATHSSILAWRIPETGEPGGLPSTGSHRVGHDWSDLAVAASANSLCDFSQHTFPLLSSASFSKCQRGKKSSQNQVPCAVVSYKKLLAEEFSSSNTFSACLLLPFPPSTHASTMSDQSLNILLEFISMISFVSRPPTRNRKGEYERPISFPLCFLLPSVVKMACLEKPKCFWIEFTKVIYTRF